MSCTQNGISMCEGRRSFALMPAIVICDNRHARMDIRPLTREQIAKIPGVRYPAKLSDMQLAPKLKPATVRITDAERARMVEMYRKRMGIMEISGTTGRHRGNVREVLKKAGVYKRNRDAKGAK